MKKLLLFLGVMLSVSIFAAETPANALELQNKEILKMAVSEISKNLPQKIDQYTTLVDVKADDLTLRYIHEVNTGAKSDEAVRNEDHARMRSAITKGTCISSKRFLESGISLSYVYNSEKSKAKLFQIDVSQKDCPLFE